MAQIICEQAGEMLLISSSKRSREGGWVLPNKEAQVTRSRSTRRVLLIAIGARLDIKR